MTGRQPAGAPQRRHVWVDVSGGYRYPGLVLAWRRTADGAWEAHTAVVRGRSVLVQWLAAADLHPVLDDRPGLGGDVAAGGGGAGPR